MPDNIVNLNTATKQPASKKGGAKKAGVPKVSELPKYYHWHNLKLPEDGTKEIDLNNISYNALTRLQNLCNQRLINEQRAEELGFYRGLAAIFEENPDLKEAAFESRCVLTIKYYQSIIMTQLAKEKGEKPARTAQYRRATRSIIPYHQSLKSINNTFRDLSKNGCVYASLSQAVSKELESPAREHEKEDYLESQKSLKNVKDEKRKAELLAIRQATQKEQENERKLEQEYELKCADNIENATKVTELEACIRYAVGHEYLLMGKGRIDDALYLDAIIKELHGEAMAHLRKLPIETDIKNDPLSDNEIRVFELSQYTIKKMIAASRAIREIYKRLEKEKIDINPKDVLNDPSTDDNNVADTPPEEMPSDTEKTVIKRRSTGKKEGETYKQVKTLMHKDNIPPLKEAIKLAGGNQSAFIEEAVIEKMEALGIKPAVK